MVQSIDELLSLYARKLQPGESISIPLFKGASSSSMDPLLARRLRNGTDNNRDRSRHELQFPRMAKFPLTVDKPDFEGALKESRMYEEEIPKVKEDSEDEEGEEGSSSLSSTSEGLRKKKKQWKKHETPRNHWIIENNAEFIEKLRLKSLKKKDPNAAAKFEEILHSRTSKRYEGLPEYNPSHYSVFQLDTNTDKEKEEQHINTHSNPNPNTETSSATSSFSNTTSSTTPYTVTTHQDKGTGKQLRTIHVKQPIVVTTMHGFQTFSQPTKLKALSMTDAEDAIANQREKMKRYMMHGKMSSSNDASHKPNSNEKGDKQNDTYSVLPHKYGPAPKSGLSRARLLDKLAGSQLSKSNNADADDDDVMGDVAFRTRKVGTVKARKELLSSLGDSDIMVDNDGIMGGANDHEFGGKKRFGRLALPTNSSNTGNTTTKEGSSSNNQAIKQTSSSSATQDGNAMQEDFYQRDVNAEYQDLDYDPNEQFDDDDVDIGADEIEDGFSPDIEDDDDDDDDDDEEEEGFDDMDEDEIAAAAAGANGLGFSTSAGMKLMIAKARGDENAAALAPLTALELAKRKRERMEAISGSGSGSDPSDEEDKEDTGTNTQTAQSSHYSKL